LGATPGIEIPIPFQREAMLLDPHVTHLHPGDEFVDGEALGAFQGVKNLQALGAADFGK
jgi:hypothetical protein